MSEKILTLDGEILINDNKIVTADISGGGGGGTNIQSSKSYTVSSSGSTTISPDTGYDGMAAVALTVPEGSATTPATTITANPTISVNTSTGLITATSSATQSVIPTISEGYVESGTAGTITVSGSNTSQLSTQAAATITPTESVQTAVAANKYTLGAIQVDAISSTYVGSDIDQNDSTDLIVSGATVTVSAGYYEENVTKTIQSGIATAPTSITGTGATASSSSTTVTLTKSVSNTPRITTAGYISSGTAGSSSISLSATDANFLAENIKNGVTLFGKAGSYTGGNVTLKPYVIRPDAELIKTYSDDFLVITDKGVTKPAYTTSSTTLISGGTALSSTVSLSNTNYRYYIVMRYLTIPQYSVTTKAAARQEYTAMSAMYEVTNYDANTFSALVSSTKYASRNAAIVAVGNAFVRCVYWSSGSAIKIYTANSYACAQTINTAPAISSGTSDSPTITFYTPNVVIRGSSTYLNSTYWGYITDIRCQYIYEVYRVPKTTTGTYGIDGWAQYNNMLQLINCAQSATHKLT